MIHEGSSRQMCWHSSVYSMVDMPGCCQQTLQALREISELELHAMVADINNWFAEGDREVWARLLARVHSRIQRMDPLLRFELGTEWVSLFKGAVPAAVAPGS
jgi:hypothetical protein